MPETDNATPTTTTCPCTNDLNFMKEYISVLNTDITEIRSFIIGQMVFLKMSAPPISDTYPEQNSQYVNVLLEQIYHLGEENENKTCVIQAPIEKQ